jgi:NADH-quinone oxidoreductase subunit L
MFEIGAQGGRSLKIPMICLVLAAAALAGLPPLSGFFSKELILTGLANLPNPIWLLSGLLGAFLTAYYAFRLIFIILLPSGRAERKEEPDTGGHAGHESDHDRRIYRLMAWPLIVLGTVTILLGFFQMPLKHFLTDGLTVPGTHAESHHAWLLYLASALALGGVGLAWLEFGRRRAGRLGFVERIPALKNFFAERWYIDHCYRLFMDYVVYRGFSYLFTQNDQRVIDGGIDGLGKGTVASGRITSFLHSGMIQYKLLVAFIVMVLLALYYFL